MGGLQRAGDDGGAACVRVVARKYELARARLVEGAVGDDAGKLGEVAGRRSVVEYGNRPCPAGQIERMNEARSRVGGARPEGERAADGNEIGLSPRQRLSRAAEVDRQ